MRATLDACFAALALLVSLAAVAAAFGGLALPLSPALVAMAGAAGVASGFYDYRTALARARFHDRAFARTIIVKNGLGLALTVGGAWWFASAPIALAGICLSVAGALASSWRALRDPGASPRRAQRALAGQFLRYGLPLIGAALLFQLIPLANRLIVSGRYGLGKSGQFSLANDLCVRILWAIGSTLDVLLFQLAVRADERHGAPGAGAQLADNMAAVLAVLLPTAVGLWLILPSFEALLVPEAFRGPFAAYLTALLPGLACYALLQFAVAPIFQIGKRTAPMIAAALAAVATDLALLALLPRGGDGAWLAVAQSGALGVALLVGLGLAAATRPVWPDAPGLLATLVATAAMAAAVLPLRALAPGGGVLAVETLVGALVYGAVAAALDVARLRERIGALVAGRAAPGRQRIIHDEL